MGRDGEQGFPRSPSPGAQSVSNAREGELKRFPSAQEKRKESPFPLPPPTPPQGFHAVPLGLGLGPATLITFPGLLSSSDIETAAFERRAYRPPKERAHHATQGHPAKQQGRSAAGEERGWPRE